MEDYPTPEKLKAIRDKVLEATRRSGPPGWVNGPADTLRHVMVAAELRRQYGPVVARAILDGNEIDANSKLSGGGFRAGTVMDHWNNGEGMDLGKGAASFEEVVERAERRTLDAIQANGRGAKNPRYLDRRYWKTDQGAPDTAEIPPEFAERVRARADKTGKRAEVDAILARPPESWSEAETRKAMDDPRYWKRQDARITTLVERSFRHRHPGTTDGPVEVDAYTRDDGTH